MTQTAKDEWNTRDFSRKRENDVKQQIWVGVKIMGMNGSRELRKSQNSPLTLQSNGCESHLWFSLSTVYVLYSWLYIQYIHIVYNMYICVYIYIYIIPVPFIELRMYILHHNLSQSYPIYDLRGIVVQPTPMALGATETPSSFRQAGNCLRTSFTQDSLVRYMSETWVRAEKRHNEEMQWLWSITVNTFQA